METTPNFSCIVKRSKRRTISLEITSQGDLVIRAPLKATDDEILIFARQHREWIARKINEMKLRQAKQEESDRQHHIRPLSKEELSVLEKAAADYIPMWAAPAPLQIKCKHFIRFLYLPKL